MYKKKGGQLLGSLLCSSGVLNWGIYTPLEKKFIGPTFHFFDPPGIHICARVYTLLASALKK